MTRSLTRMALAATVSVLLAWACDNTNTPTNPGNPSTPEYTTVTFEGSLNVNGAHSYGFGTLSGTVTATLTSFGPDSELAVGLSLGTWSGSACNIIIANDNAPQGTVVVGTAGSIGTLCVRIYDVGNLTETLPFVITVEHP